MAAVSGVNLAMLPEEHAAFWEFLASTGDIWACALGDHPRERQHEPAPAGEFVRRFAKKIRHYDCVEVYLGHRAAVLKPRVCYVTETVGGREVLLSKPGMYPRVSKIVGGKRVRRPHLDFPASELIRYSYGVVNRHQVMNRTTASYYPSYLSGEVFERKPDEFLKWARKVIGWLRRRISAEVPVYRCHDTVPATALAAEAVGKGLKVV
jgi:hypothetical protein